MQQDPIITPLIINIGLEIGISVGAGAAIASVATPLIIGGALLGASMLLSPRPQSAAAPLPSPSDGSQSIQQAIPPRIYGVGIAAPGGKLLLFDTFFGVLIQVTALLDDEYDGIEQLMLSGDPVGTDGVSDDPAKRTFGGTVTSAQRGGYTGNIVTMVAALGVSGSVPFGLAGFGARFNDFFGTGITLLFTRCNGVSAQDFTSHYPAGKPSPGAIIRCVRVWDPRDPAQSFSDSSTWAFSQNVALCWLWYECFCAHGPQRDVASAILPVLQFWKDAAAACDDAMQTKAGGTIPRYQIGYWWTADVSREQVRGMFAAACDGALFELPDGSIILRVGSYVDSGVILTDDDITDYFIQTDLPVEDRVNELNIKFSDRNNFYGASEADPFRDDAQIVSDGQLISQSVDLWQVQELNQAKRLGRASWNRQNEKLRGSLTCNLGGLKLLGERWASVQSARIPRLSNEVIEILSYRQDVINGRVSIDFVRSGAFVYAYDPNDPVFGDGNPPPIATLSGDAIPVPANVTAATVVDDSVAGYHIDVAFDDPQRSDLSFAIEYRTADTGAGAGPWTLDNFTSSAAVIAAGRATLSIFPPSPDFYEVQMTFVGPRGGYSTWATGLFVAAPGSPYLSDASGGVLFDNSGGPLADA